MNPDVATNIKDDLTGVIAITLNHGSRLDEYCAAKIPDYNPDRFEALAVRVYYGKETIVTLYAVDKSRQEGNNFTGGKIPVKKFKTDVSFLKGFSDHIGELNFTLTTGNYPLADMEVINK